MWYNHVGASNDVDVNTTSWLVLHLFDLLGQDAAHCVYSIVEPLAVRIVQLHLLAQLKRDELSQ
jgi:hypothetical protein